MRIWIDFINTPQVSFFIPFIRAFKKDGHELFLTCRDSGNTVYLLQKYNLDFQIVGNIVKESTAGKILYYPRRIIDLWRIVKQRKPEIAVGQSSFYMPVVARLLGIPSLYTNDNEHAKGNIFGFIFSDAVLLPEVLEGAAFTRRWPLRDKIDFYPSIKEAIYLSQSRLGLNRFSDSEKVIYYRPEPSTAQYYQGPKHFLDKVLRELSEMFQIVVLPRDEEQVLHYKSLVAKNIEVCIYPLDFEQIVANCLLFIGAGGSMNRELAVLGIPVVSIYQARRLAVDQFLIDGGFITIVPKLSAEGLINLIQKGGAELDTRGLLSAGRRSFDMILTKINKMQYA